MATGAHRYRSVQTVTEAGQPHVYSIDWDVGNRVGPVTGLMTSLALLLIVIATDVWVYTDARRCAAEGSPVFLRVGTFRIDTPVAWLVSCVVLWIFFFPTYLVSRSRS